MNFERIADKFALGTESRLRLANILHEAADRDREYTLNQLAELVEPPNTTQLAALLGCLVREGELRKIIRVVSPTTQGGIGDFDSLEQVPNEVRDWRTDTMVEVKPDDLRVVYIIPAHNDAAGAVQS